MQLDWLDSSKLQLGERQLLEGNTNSKANHNISNGKITRFGFNLFLNMVLQNGSCGLTHEVPQGHLYLSMYKRIKPFGSSRITSHFLYPMTTMDRKWTPLQNTRHQIRVQPTMNMAYPQFSDFQPNPQDICARDRPNWLKTSITDPRKEKTELNWPEKQPLGHHNRPKKCITKW